MRWSQSQEPAEAADLARDKTWLRRLACYVRGQGIHQAAFQLCENSSS